MMINYKKLIKNYIVMMLSAVLVLSIVFKGISVLKISDSLAVVGILTFVLACFKASKYLGLYDLFAYGSKKIVEIIFCSKYEKTDSKVGEYCDYLKKNKKNKDFIELFVNSTTFFAISLVLAFLV